MFYAYVFQFDFFSYIHVRNILKYLVSQFNWNHEEYSLEIR